MILALDTATAATVVGVAATDGTLLAQRRHDPAPGERPGHTTQLLPLAQQALAEAGGAWGAITRIGAGVGPGTFTGIRIGVATARALAQGLDAETVAIPTLDALALGAAAAVAPGNVLAVLDARRGPPPAGRAAPGCWARRHGGPSSSRALRPWPPAPGRPWGTGRYASGRSSRRWASRSRRTTRTCTG
jgi:hypothetical protein